MLTKEQKAFRTKWVAALRSGKYEQARKVLRRSENRFCCLGLACDLSKARKWNGGDYGDDFRGDEIPDDLLTPLSGLSFDDAYHLAQMNDGGARFAEIADTIELLTLADS
jgi:hypothetical protein